MNDLAVGIGIATGCDSLFHINGLRVERANRSQCSYAQGGHSLGHSRIARCPHPARGKTLSLDFRVRMLGLRLRYINARLFVTRNLVVQQRL